MLPVRQEVADFIWRRDGCPPVDPENIFLTNGASDGVRAVYDVLLRDPAEGFRDGVLTPIPQYPLYSARSTLTGGTLVPYHLDETNGWSVSVEKLRGALTVARAGGVCVRAIVVINPGNPTGQVLSEADVKGIIELAATENLAIVADEVYQDNIWGARPFISFKRAACEMGFDAAAPGAVAGEAAVGFAPALQIFSLHSTSKGFLGECGFRGGYMELHGVPADVHAQFYKLACISLCSNTLGQIMTGLMVNPPTAGDASYAQYAAERDAILSSLKRRATALVAALNALEGVTCQPAEGAMYAFPRLMLPAKAVVAAAAAGVPADEFYCLKVLDRTGIILVPGSGFGQEEGTYHFRSTFLPQESKMPAIVESLSKAHAAFLAEYA
ncbi:unnamed protein product [Phaeothamnion confervicola]